MISVRFAPSPTGHLHIGGVRTALFNFFYAKNRDGQLVLRIEDTDVSRSSDDMAKEIINGLKWLGINWDKGPFYQSQRFQHYEEMAMRLLQEKKAYRCFCTPEEIEKRRNGTAQNNEKIYKYDRKCLDLSPEEINKKLELGTPFVIRFLIPEGKTYFKDALHKEMETDNNQLDDFVLLKSDKSPTYHLSVVVDDSDMEISHVIRGDDHLSNTFKQVLLFKALGLKPPKFAHLPLILGSDKKKLSKRHGETSVLEFKKQGYLSEAVINYLSRLSWLPADNKKIFTVDELIKAFNLSKLSKSSPVFDYDMLRFINGKAIQQKKSSDLYDLLLENEDFKQRYSSFDKERIISLIQLIKPRLKSLLEFLEKFDIYLAGKLIYSENEHKKLNEKYDDSQVIEYLRLVLNDLLPIASDNFKSSYIEKVIRECAETNGLKAADFIHPARFALTSETVSPSIFDIFEFFGKEESIRRLNRFIDTILEMESMPNDDSQK